MKFSEALNIAHMTLEENNIPHALIGGLALAILGINRSTCDIDFIVDADFKELAKIELSKKGFILKTETEEVLHFKGIAYLDLLLAKRPLSKEMLLNATKSSFMKINCLKVEDIIGLKIQAYKNDKSREYKDKADILSLFEIHKNLDLNKVKFYADLFGEWDFIKKILKVD